MRQIGALPLLFHTNGSVEVLLVTSRFGSRWIIPKGNPMAGVAPTDVAAIEALEEGGIVGTVLDYRLGSFRLASKSKKCTVDVYPMIVEEQLPHWDEAGERQCFRCDLETAQLLVSSPSLANLLRDVNPKKIMRKHKESQKA